MPVDRARARHAWHFTAFAASLAAHGAAMAQSAAASAYPEQQRAGDGAAADDIVVTASRAGGGIDRDLLGSSATVIGPQALEDRQTRIVSDVLRDVPGVAVNRAGAVGDLTQVRIRGAESNHVLTIIDGIKADDPYQGEFDYGTLLADETARIEVLRGQQSSLYGSDAIGGVITYTTLSGREAPGVRAHIEGGSYGTAQGALRIAGANDAIDYALSASAERTAGYPVAPGGTRDVGARLAGLSGKLNWAPATDVRITAVGRYDYARSETDDFAANPAIPDAGGVSLLGAVDAPGDYAINRAAYGLLRTELDSFGGAMTTAASAQIADTHRDGFTDRVRDSGDHGQRQRYSLEDTIRLGDGAVRHRVTVAFDAERQAFRNTAPGPFVDDGEHVLRTYGLLGQYQLTVSERFGLGGSVRHDWNDFFGDDTTWHADVSYRLAHGPRLHAAAGTGVKDPGPFELFDYAVGSYIGNPKLRPERSRGWEAGVDQSLWQGHVTIGATYFDSRLHDEIETVYLPPDFTASSVNAATTTHQRGVEAFAEARLAAWRFAAAYTYLHAPQVRDVLAEPTADAPMPVSAQAVRRPKTIASLNATWHPAVSPFALTLTIRYNGRQTDLAYTSAFQTLYVRLHAYTLVNLNATYALSARVQLYARVENLLDRAYQEAFGYAAQGRAGYGGVRLRF